MEDASCTVCGKEAQGLQCERCHSGAYYCGQECLASARASGHEEVCAKLPAGWDVNFIWCIPPKGSSRKRLQQHWEELGALPRDVGWARGVELIIPDELNPFKDMVADCTLFIQAVKFLSDFPESTSGKHPSDLSFFISGGSFWHLFPDGRYVTLPETGETLGVGYLSWNDDYGRTPQGVASFTAGIGQWFLGPDADGKLLGLGRKGAARMPPAQWAAMLAETVQTDSEKLPEGDAKTPPYRAAVRMVGETMSDVSRWSNIFDPSFADSKKQPPAKPELGRPVSEKGKILVPCDSITGEPLALLAHGADFARLALAGPDSEGLYSRRGGTDENPLISRSLAEWVEAACENMLDHALKMDEGRIAFGWPAVFHMFSFALRKPELWKLVDVLPATRTSCP